MAMIGLTFNNEVGSYLTGGNVAIEKIFIFDISVFFILERGAPLFLYSVTQ